MHAELSPPPAPEFGRADNRMMVHIKSSEMLLGLKTWRLVDGRFQWWFEFIKFIDDSMIVLLKLSPGKI